MSEPRDCEHEDLALTVDYKRLTKGEDGPVEGYVIEIRAQCTQCAVPFCFRGMPNGLSHLEPRMSLDARTAYMPMHPENDPTAGIGLPGFNVRGFGASEPGVDP